MTKVHKSLGIFNGFIQDKILTHFCLDCKGAGRFQLTSGLPELKSQNKLATSAALTHRSPSKPPVQLPACLPCYHLLPWFFLITQSTSMPCSRESCWSRNPKALCFLVTGLEVGSRFWINEDEIFVEQGNLVLILGDRAAYESRLGSMKFQGWVFVYFLKL